MISRQVFLECCFHLYSQESLVSFILYLIGLNLNLLIPLILKRRSFLAVCYKLHRHLVKMEIEVIHHPYFYVMIYLSYRFHYHFLNALIHHRLLHNLLLRYHLNNLRLHLHLTLINSIPRHTFIHHPRFKGSAFQTKPITDGFIPHRCK